MKNYEELVREFLDASIKYGKAIEVGDSKKANKYSSIIRKIRHQLTVDCKLQILIPNINHDDDYVKLNVAVSLINILPEDSKKILQDLQMKKGLLGLEAEMFLQEWEKCNIKF